MVEVLGLNREILEATFPFCGVFAEEFMTR
jgi:hypothetical protein